VYNTLWGKMYSNFEDAFLCTHTLNTSYIHIHCILLTLQKTLVERDYYSVVGQEEPSICEDVNGMVCQDDTTDGHKMHTDYILMLASILSPKVHKRCY